MTTTINASTSSGLVNTADTSGIIKLQSNGVTTNALAWVNFATALTDANYTWAVNMNGLSVTNGYFIGNNTVPSTTALQILTITSAAAYADPTAVSVTVFGN